jgi:hypothetical protein
MNISEAEITPQWFWLQKWLDVAKYQVSGMEWTND